MTQLPNVEEFAIAQDVPHKEEEIRILSYVGLKWINENRERLLAPTCEHLQRVEIGDEIVMRGKIDVYDDRIESQGCIEIWDYKTVQKTDVGAARQQMTAYAYLAAANAGTLPMDATIIVRLIWLRDQEVSTLRFTPAELVEWVDDLPRRIKWDGQTHTPGDACRWCPRVAECEGRIKLYRAGIEILSNSTEIVPTEGRYPADPTKWGNAIMQAKLLRQLCDDFLRSSAVEVGLAGGEVAMPNGCKIVLKSRAGSASLDPGATIQRLRAMMDLTDEDLAQVVSVKKAAVEKLIGSLAPHGEKGARIKETLEAWEEEGILKRGKPAEWVDVVSEEA